ncbi:MAG: hypothetical protein J0H51_15050 [Rhizobiales bacterium]|nr:hypothetical protein [Hyphomicrobiales bacterium]
MSQMFSVQRAVIAAALTVAAAPFAMGGELPAWLVRSPMVATAAAPALVGDPVNNVERAGKSDRAPVVRAGVDSQTFSIQPSGMSGTSVLVRIVSRKSPDNQATKKPATQLQPRSKTSRPRAACEPVVSMLTDVAKRLEPGRCVT